MSTRRTYDCLIVGAGPAGSACAITLAERGFDVLMLDKARFPRSKACAEYINPEAGRLLEQLGLGQPVLDAGAATFRGMRVVAPSGQAVNLDFLSDCGRGALGLSRYRLDVLAVERCRLLGVDVIEGAHVRDVLVEDGRAIGVHARVRQEPVLFRARAVVGADGHHSVVARRLGLDLPVRWPKRIGLAAQLRGFVLDGSFGEMHVGAGAYCGIAPQEDGLVNAAMVVDMRQFQERSTPAQDYFDAAIRAYPGLMTRAGCAERVGQVRGVGPLARRVRQVVGDGYVLVGDAAGFFDPFTGEGIHEALSSGVQAGDVLAGALDALDTSSGRLAEYARRRAEARSEKLRAARLVQLFVGSPRLMSYALHRIAGRPDVAQTLTGVLGDYRDAGIVVSPRFLWSALRP